MLPEAPRQHLLPTIALILLVGITFGRVATHEFVNFDDDKLIYTNPNLVPPTLHGLETHWRKPHSHLYIPVVYTAWWVLAQLGLVHDLSGGVSLNPWVFHAASVLVHLVNVLLVWRIVRAVVRDDVAAAIAAAVFAVHPLQTEAVAWATGMKDLLCGTFSLLAIVAAMEATQQRRRAPIWWIAASVCYALLALLSKPSAVVVPVIAASLLWLIDAPPRARSTVLVVGMLIAQPIVVITQTVQPAPDVPPTALWTRPLVAGDALAFYLSKLAWPFGLAIDQGRTPTAVIASGAVWWTWIIPAAITIGVIASRKRVLIVAWVIFVAALAPNLGLTPFQYQVLSTVSERYAYLALLGVAIAMAFAITRVPHGRVIACCVAAALAIVSFVQAGHWRDSESLWRHTIAVNPRSSLAYGNLGALLLDRGDTRDALSQLMHAAELDANDAYSRMNLARAYLTMGDTAHAALAARGLADAYSQRKDFDPALTAAVLQRFADEISRRGDPAAAQLVRDKVHQLSPTTQP